MHMSEVTICYGMTETSPVSFQTSPDDPVQERVSTVGKVHPHVQAKVVDPDCGTLLPRDVPGDLPAVSVIATVHLQVIHTPPSNIDKYRHGPQVPYPITSHKQVTVVSCIRGHSSGVHVPGAVTQTPCLILVDVMLVFKESSQSLDVQAEKPDRTLRTPQQALHSVWQEVC